MRACDIYSGIRRFIDHQQRVIHPAKEIRMYLDADKTQEVSSFGFVGDCYLSFFLWEGDQPDAQTVLLPPSPIPLWFDLTHEGDSRSRHTIGFLGDLPES